MKFSSVFSEATEKFRSYDNVKDRIVLQLAGAARKEEGEQDGFLFLEYRDMYIMFSYLLDTKKVNAAVPIKESWLQEWGVTTEQLLRTALMNSEILLKPVMKDVREFLGDELDLPPTFYVLTNERTYCGAAVILYPGLVESVAELFEDDLILLPSSIHEFLVLPAADNDEKCLSEIVREVNKTVVAPSDCLSDSVYRYRRESGKLEICGSSGEKEPMILR